jgi:hypothetical protein
MSYLHPYILSDKRIAKSDTDITFVPGSSTTTVTGRTWIEVKKWTTAAGAGSADGSYSPIPAS